MKIGIVGLPNVGKSTLFNALTKSYSADMGNFPFCTIDPNVGIVDVKDQRVDKLSDMSNSKKKVYSVIEFVDIAGLVKGSGKGEGLGNKFLSHIKEVDAIVQVLRYFKDTEVSHVEGEIDPIRDKNIIDYELIFSDLQIIEKNLPSLEKKAVSGKKKEDLKLVEILKKIKSVLEQGKLANIADLTRDEKKIVKSYNFLTLKPFVFALNISQDDIEDYKIIKEEYEKKMNQPVSIVCAKLESELLELEEDEQNEFKKELLEMDNIDHLPVLDDLIKLVFDTIGLMYFFTTGEKETKAWTVKKGSFAPQAAGVIHTDFERGFIKAEVINADVLLEKGSWSKAKEDGVLKLEGKEYIVQDGDVIIFKFNV